MQLADYQTLVRERSIKLSPQALLRAGVPDMPVATEALVAAAGSGCEPCVSLLAAVKPAPSAAEALAAAAAGAEVRTAVGSRLLANCAFKKVEGSFCN